MAEKKTRTFLGRREAPFRSAIKKLVEKFELLGQVVENKTHARRSRTAENIASVAESFEENPGLSIPHRSLELGIPQTSLHGVLHKDSGLNAYKVQLTQEPATIQDLKDGIREAIEDIGQTLCDLVMQNNLVD